MIELPVLPALPEGSAIRVLRGRRGVRLRWPDRSRLPLPVFVICVLIFLLGVLGMSVAESRRGETVGGLLAFLGGIIGFICVLWYLSMWSHRSTLVLESERLVYYAPARRRPFAFPDDWLGLQMRGGLGVFDGSADAREIEDWRAELKAERGRRRNVMARSTDVHLENLGAFRGIAVAAGRSVTLMGWGLGEADREWLVSVLKRWKDSEA